MCLLIWMNPVMKAVLMAKITPLHGTTNMRADAFFTQPMDIPQKVILRNISAPFWIRIANMLPLLIIVRDINQKSSTILWPLL